MELLLAEESSIPEELEKVHDKTEMDEDGGVGISLPGGVINGAPKSKDVRKMRKTLDLEK